MRWKTPLQNQKGFTLVEIAIVLIIIGLILGATVKGKDLMQSAKQKKFYNGFVKGWEILILNYYDRTGNVLGDTSGNNQFNNINSAGEFTTLETEINRVGLEIPSTNATNYYDYSYKGINSGTVNIGLNLMYRAPNNVMEFDTMPTEVAIAIDNIIDGKADGTTGRFVNSTGADWDTATDATSTAQYTVDVP